MQSFGRLCLFSAVWQTWTTRGWFIKRIPIVLHWLFNITNLLSILSLIPNPWRIVLPAFAFFLLMAVLSVFYACRSQGLLNKTCDSLSEAFDRNGSIPACPDLFNHFTRPIGLVKASVLYFAFIAFSYLTMIFWWCLTLLMLLRCLLGVDFQRTEVEIKPLSTVSEHPNGST